MAPDTVAIDDLTVSYSLHLSLSIDLSFLDFCLPQICIWTPWGDLCTPKICFTFPTISVPISFSSSASLSADFGLDVHLTSGTWDVDVVIQDVRELDLGPGRDGPGHRHRRRRVAGPAGACRSSG